ncbi:MAG TPA: hypothetical protein VG271_03010 [Beijerinckiaceae bacterium]|jgi:hypothetical protein|nr:hypothetical protein [Beijerinckiaceae bacterium]
MGSVLATWKGALADRAAQDELLTYIERFAELSAEFLKPKPKLPTFSEVLAGRRRQGVPERPIRETIDRTVGGGVLIRSDIFADKTAFPDAVRQAGLPLEIPQLEPDYPLARVGSASLHGCDFQLFDPRRLYPGADRLTFVFMTCPEAPFLDGRLVSARPIAEVSNKLDDVARGASWFLECPFIHLRYVLEDWTFRLFCWVRHFFMPELYWWGGEELIHYEEEKAVFQRLEADDGREAAKQAGFFILMESFRADAEAWGGHFAEMRDKEDR